MIDLQDLLRAACEKSVTDSISADWFIENVWNRNKELHHGDNTNQGHLVKIGFRFGKAAAKNPDSHPGEWLVAKVRWAIGTYMKMKLATYLHMTSDIALEVTPDDNPLGNIDIRCQFSCERDGIDNDNENE